ncbi:uncharacterized protein M6B38_282715 [Iris pallida]|uniref:CCHC-type domain-containing protein n=1 Tax=Iris pallida TaxID=29817 RepID=A0AAX6I058_IRIPA|nr:uncharacterized protein M6B38_282715 [Iris pallida]
MPEKNNIVSETSSSEAELKIPNHKEVVYETAISESPLVSSSQSIAVSSSILFRESDKKAFAQPLVSEKGTGFTFPITSDNCSHSQQPPAPIEPTPLLNQPAFQMEAILKKLDADDVATLMKLIKVSAGDSATRASPKLELPSIDLKLDGPATYLSWSRRVRRILAGKNLEGFLTGEKTEPEEGSTERDEWKSTHMVIYIWLLNSLVQSIASTVDDIEMVKDVWEKLRRTYDGVENNLRIFQIKGNIDDTVQGEKTVQEYATELERLWLDYDHSSKRTSCGDPKCQERHVCLQERTMKFLTGLTAAFAQRTALLLAQPEIPSLEEAISAMIQEETRIRLQTGTSGPPEAKSALAAASSGDPGSKGELWQHNRQCYNCGEMGHHRYACTKPPKEGNSGGGRGRGYIGRGRGRGGRRGVRGGYRTNLLVVEGNGGAGGTFTDEDHALLNLLERKQRTLTERDRDGSSSKLTPGMLHGGALRSMEEIDTSKFSSVQDIGTTSDSHLPTIGSFSSGKVDMVEEKGRSKFSTVGVKLASETNGLKNASTPSTDANPGRRSTYSVVSAAPPQSKRPSFQMSAPEDSLELDDDDYNTTNLASPLTKENSAAELKKPEPQNVISETTASEAALKMPEKNNIVSETSSSSEAELKIPNHKEVVYETAISESPLVSSSQSIAVSCSVLFRESDKKAFAQPLVSEKGTGFTFPITSVNCSHSQQPPAPIEPTPLLNQPAFQKEQTSLFSSGSSAANIFAVSSTTVGVNGSAGVKVDAGTGSELKSSSRIYTASSTPASTLPPFGVLNPAIGFGSVISWSPGNDQMNVEDTMTDDTNQAPSFPTFGQPANHTASPFTFGSPAVQPGGPPVSQFGSHQNPSVPRNPPRFQTTGNLELPQGGSFSLGSGGGDKAGRKYVRVVRIKQRKK